MNSLQMLISVTVASCILCLAPFVSDAAPCNDSLEAIQADISTHSPDHATPEITVKIELTGKMGEGKQIYNIIYSGVNGDNAKTEDRFLMSEIGDISTSLVDSGSLFAGAYSVTLKCKSRARCITHFLSGDSFHTKKRSVTIYIITQAAADRLASRIRDFQSHCGGV